MSLTARDVAEILKVLEESSFDSLELEINGTKLQLRRGEAGVRAAPVAAGSSAGTAARVAPAATAPRHAPSIAVPVEAPPGTKAVPAPLLGVFYRAPKPGEPPFVEVGSHVAADTIVGIIEVMKLMNTVRAGVSGEVVAIPARNGELVEYGEALLFVREA